MIYKDKDAADLIDAWWDSSILPCLQDYIRIPNKSPLFAPDWAAEGHMDRAAELLAAWCRSRPVEGMKVGIRQLPGRTPLLVVDVAGQVPDCVLLYGHLDKQPEFSGWSDGLSPWEPVIRDGRLYGRGGADDGYAVFSSLAAIAALQAQRVPHARCVILIEAAEESGSTDLPAYIAALAPELGEPSMVVCLDADCGNYEQLWCTTSLRGNLSGTLRVRMLREGVHSGMGTGIAAAPFRVAQQLLMRLENPVTGDILPEALQAQVPRDRLEQARAAAAVLGPGVAARMPFVAGAQPLSNDPVELLIGSTWRSTLAVTGADGLPSTGSAGNVLLPEITLKLSLRLPPTTDATAAANIVKQLLEHAPPYGAEVTFDVGSAMSGWNAPSFAPWLEASLQHASRQVYGHDAVHAGCGGSIPFMGMLGKRFPRTQFLITGVLGPQSNAHGPNEFLHIEYARRLTRCVARVLADHGQRPGAA